MTPTDGNKNDHQDVLARLVHDLTSKETLCRVKDYPFVTLQQLNEYLTEQGPLVNPLFGEQPAFFIDEGHFIPYRVVVYGNEKVAAKIGRKLDEWATWSPQGGRVTTSQGAFILEQRPRRPKVRMSDVAYTPRDEDRNLERLRVWTYRGDPFVPTFVVEIDKLSGRGSQRWALNRKMRNEYFAHGIQLGWLIDPRPECRKMYEYYLDEHGEVQCSDDTTWRDLDGRDVLPGFHLRSVVLEMVLSQHSGSSAEEDVDLTCAERGCRQRFNRRRAFAAHSEWHREEEAIATYLANSDNQ